MLKVKIKERNILELLEDGKKGDLIDLSLITSIDHELLNSKIEEEFSKRLNIERENTKNQTLVEVQQAFDKYNKQITLLNKEKEDIKSITLQEEKTKYEIDKINLENYYKAKEVDLTNKINNLLSELNDIKIKTTDSLTNEFDSKINSIKEKHLEEIRKIENENKELIIKEIELNNQLKSLNNEKEQAKEVFKSNLESELIKKEAELSIKFKEEISIKDKEISNLTNQRAIKNTKQTGEDLESWCDIEVKTYMQNGFLNCTWLKDNIAIKEDGDTKGSKADFLFSIYSNENKDVLLTNICLEMKDENPDSVNRKKNEDHFKVLDKNRIKKGCKYALLVSNLELDKPNDLPMYKVLEFPDMYVVRPAYLMTFLNILVSLSVKFKDLILNIEKEKIEFKSSTDLLEEFESLKKTYLDKPLELLRKEIEGIKTASNSIITSAEKINKYIDSIKIKYIEEIENKINRFNIKKVSKKI